MFKDSFPSYIGVKDYGSSDFGFKDSVPSYSGSQYSASSLFTV